MEDGMIEYRMGGVWTLAFLNESFRDPTPTVWVFTDRETYLAELARLQGQNHIRIVQNGVSLVKGGA